jgi:signal transduction histidine kinase
VLERLGLPAALRHLAGRFGKRGPAAFRLRLPSPFPEIPPKLETVIYRLSQEFFQNALKHSGATRVNLSLKTTDKRLELAVTDNGAGFDVDRALLRRDSFGLAGMRERVALLGGTLRVRSSPGRGTAISAGLPLF